MFDPPRSCVGAWLQNAVVALSEREREREEGSLAAAAAVVVVILGYTSPVRFVRA